MKGICILNSGGGNYSTKEQVIGTWIDGKTLYRKVLVNTITSTESYIDASALNIGTVATIKLISFNSGDYGSDYYASSDSKLKAYYMKSGKIKVDSGTYPSRPFQLYITLEYTKK